VLKIQFSRGVSAQAFPDVTRISCNGLSSEDFFPSGPIRFSMVTRYVIAAAQAIINTFVERLEIRPAWGAV
jgi:hypothetical protein